MQNPATLSQAQICLTQHQTLWCMPLLTWLGFTKRWVRGNGNTVFSGFVVLFAHTALCIRSHDYSAGSAESHVLIAIGVHIKCMTDCSVQCENVTRKL